jgi:hypothetical protein
MSTVEKAQRLSVTTSFSNALLQWHRKFTPSTLVVQISTRVRCSIRLGMDVHLGGAATMPGSEKDTAATALVLDILEGVHNVGNAAQAKQAAETESPGVCGISNLIRNVGHRSLSARRAIRWRGSSTQARDRGRALVDRAALLLRWHTRLLHVAGLLVRLGLRIRVLGLLRRWRTRILLRGRRSVLLGLLCVHGLLLLLLLVHHVRVLVVDRRLLLACHVRGLGVLLHRDTLLLHCDGRTRRKF